MPEQQGKFRYRLISSKTYPDTYQPPQEEHNEKASATMDGVLFTYQARQALTRAFTQANSLHHSYIDSFHLLLGLLEDPQDLPAIILARLGSIDQMKDIIYASIHPGYDVTLGELSLTPSYQTAIDRAAEEAQKLNQSRVGSEHLLLALAYDLSDVSGSVFLRLGIHADQIKEQIQQKHLS